MWSPENISKRSNVAVTWQKDHSERGFIQKEMGILDPAIPSNIKKIKKEYSHGNIVTRLKAKIVTHKEALIVKIW